MMNTSQASVMDLVQSVSSLAKESYEMTGCEGIPNDLLIAGEIIGQKPPQELFPDQQVRQPFFSELSPYLFCAVPLPDHPEELPG